VYDFLQGAVYCWCKNRKGDWFSMRELMGGDNSDWTGTPLIDLYQKQMGRGLPEPQAIEMAGKESGWMLKHVLDVDARTFETRKQEQIRQYRWVEPAGQTRE
jgi:hypothetical protein